MGAIKEDDVLVITIGEEMVCRECISDEEWNDAEENDFHTEDEAEKAGELWFCERCKKKSMANNMDNLG